MWSSNQPQVTKCVDFSCLSFISLSNNSSVAIFPTLRSALPAPTTAAPVATTATPVATTPLPTAPATANAAAPKSFTPPQVLFHQVSSLSTNSPPACLTSSYNFVTTGPNQVSSSGFISTPAPKK